MSQKIAVVLFQLGGPDSLEAVEPFLYNLFLDPDIIDFPLASLAREPLARYISTRRSRKVAEKYKEIGGKSPILELTQQQAHALEKELQKTVDAKVFIAMRYWHPLTDSVVRELVKSHFDHIVLLPLYPQYSKTTTGSSLNEWNRWCSSLGLNHTSQEIIYHFYDHPLYVESLIDRINESLTKFIDRQSVTLVFSAHGVPASVIRSGDPYKDHVEKTVELVLKKGGWNLPHVLCYQSKVGPAKWLHPSLDESIHQLGRSGAKNALAIPIAFVSDHIETLHEINIEARGLAASVGISRFEMMVGLNDHPKFIQALADLVLKTTT
jgi:ferrochelatase